MRTRDAPGIVNPAPVIQPRIEPFQSADSRIEKQPTQPGFVTRNEPPVKPSKLMAKPQSERTRKTERKPSQKRAAKPPAVTGYHWRKDGAGWDLRKDVYVEE